MERPESSAVLLPMGGGGWHSQRALAWGSLARDIATSGTSEFKMVPLLAQRYPGVEGTSRGSGGPQSGAPQSGMQAALTWDGMGGAGAGSPLDLWAWLSLHP